MPGCCSHFECAANQQFNQKKVGQELKRYRQKGAGPTNRLLVDGISEAGALAGTVLDVVLRHRGLDACALGTWRLGCGGGGRLGCVRQCRAR